MKNGDNVRVKTKWHERLAAFKKYYGYKNADLARMSGNTLQSVKNISQREVPGWLKFAIQVWENEYRDFPIPENFNLNHKYGRVEVVENDGVFSAQYDGEVFKTKPTLKSILAWVEEKSEQF